MGWNEPPGGDKGKGKDPWGKRGNGEGPPDIDEIIRKMQQGFGGLFGRRPTGVGDHGSPLPWVLIFLALFAWFAYDMVYTIDQQERGVVLRFGQYVATLQPGLSIRFPQPIEEVIMVNVGQLRSLTHKANMLTQDENIVDVEVAVQWKIGDPAKFLFNVYLPAATLRQATESAVRNVIGKSKLDFVLTEGRSEIAQRQQQLIQEIMDDYKTGIHISKVEMQSAKPPDEVKAAFDDAIKAREDEQRYVNEAEAYRNDVIPKARGGAARLREESNAYRARVIAKAEGEASRFEQLLTEYERAPEVTRQRLYLDSIESVLSNTNKVLLDTEGSNSLMYIPIDKLLQQRGTSQSLSIPKEYRPDQQRSSSTDTRDVLPNRNRGVR
ncbi:MAG: FtsH protease activity modulator HflK [Gammaproteobacteria bacterium]